MSKTKENTPNINDDQQEPFCFIRWDVDKDSAMWDEDCVCEDNVYNDRDAGTVGKPLYTQPQFRRLSDAEIVRQLCFHGEEFKTRKQRESAVRWARIITAEMINKEG